jgi:DNA modification methylase
MRPEIIQGEVREVLKTLDDESVQCVVTSPPYWGLRDYGNPPLLWGGDPECNHEFGEEFLGDTRDNNIGKKRWNHTFGQEEISPHIDVSQGRYCKKCGAWEGNLGLEPTPEQFTKNIVEIFREVKRVLRKDGTVWLNLGDSYAGTGYKGENTDPKHKDTNTKRLKNKDLVGVPWRAAFALQADGWYLRSDIIWQKPNPMPESVKDRPTKSHEHIFLLTKSNKYFYDNDAIREPVSEASLKRAEHSWDCDRPSTKNAAMGGKGIHTEKMGKRFVDPKGRNKRDVWSINVQPYKEAHFATFPEELPETCIKAGTKKGDVVLDIFAGSGTTLRVASKLGRKGIGIEINKEYLEIARKRCKLENESLASYL